MEEDFRNPDVAYDVMLYSRQLKDLLDALHLSKRSISSSFGRGRTITAFAAQYPERVKNLVYVDAAGFNTITETPHFHGCICRRDSGF